MMGFRRALVILGLLATVSVAAQDFRDSYFGDTMEQVKEVEGQPRFTLGDGTMMYYTDGGNFSFKFTPIRRT